MSFDEDQARSAERDRAIIRARGEYGTVDLVAGSVQQFCQDRGFEKEKKRAGWRARALLKGISGFNRFLGDFDRAHYIVAHQMVGEDDLRGLPDTLDPKARLAAVNAFGAIVKTYLDARGNRPCELGLILSDTLQVLPPQLAAVLLGSASDPQVASEILERRAGHEVVRGFDLQRYAIEAAVLLPVPAQNEIFAEMARLDPGRQGRARRLLSQIATNFHQRNSPYSGVSLIYRNLEGEAASERVLKTQGNLAHLGEIIK